MRPAAPGGPVLHRCGGPGFLGAERGCFRVTFVPRAAGLFATHGSPASRCVVAAVDSRVWKPGGQRARSWGSEKRLQGGPCASPGFRPGRQPCSRLLASSRVTTRGPRSWDAPPLSHSSPQIVPPSSFNGKETFDKMSSAVQTKSRGKETLPKCCGTLDPPRYGFPDVSEPGLGVGVRSQPGKVLGGRAQDGSTCGDRHLFRTTPPPTAAQRRLKEKQLMQQTR